MAYPFRLPGFAGMTAADILGGGSSPGFTGGPPDTPDPRRTPDPDPNAGRNNLIQKYMDWMAKKRATTRSWLDEMVDEQLRKFPATRRYGTPPNPSRGDGAGGGVGDVPPSTIPPGTEDVPDPRFPNPLMGVGGERRDRRNPGPEPTRGLGIYDEPGFVGPPEPLPDYLEQGPYPRTPRPVPTPQPRPAPAPPPSPPSPRTIGTTASPPGVRDDRDRRGGGAAAGGGYQPRADTAFDHALQIIFGPHPDITTWEPRPAPTPPPPTRPSPSPAPPPPPPPPPRTVLGGDVPDPRFPGGLNPALDLEFGSNNFGSLWPDFGARGGVPVPTPRPAPAPPPWPPRPAPSPSTEAEFTSGEGRPGPLGPWWY